jgi:hypothetical protein
MPQATQICTLDFPPAAEIPNLTLMSQSAQVNSKALAELEMEICVSLDWDVSSVLRAHNHVY